MGPDAREALASIKPFLSHSDPRLQFAAYRATGEIEALPASPSLPEMQDVAAWKGPGGYAAFKAQWKIPDARARSPVLKALFLDTQLPEYVRASAFPLLGEEAMEDPVVVRAALVSTSGEDALLSPLVRTALPHAAVRLLADALRDPRPGVRLQAALALKSRGHDAAPAIPNLCEALRAADGATEAGVIAAYLDVLRAVGKTARPAADVLSGLLSEEARLWSGRDKGNVTRLRAYLFVTLSDIGVPSSAIGPIIDALVNTDERMSSLEAVAAARAAGFVQTGGQLVVGHLVQALEKGYFDETFSLERYETEFPTEEATTFSREAIRALWRLGPQGNQEALALLDRMAKGEHATVRRDPSLAAEARRALNAISNQGRGPERPLPFTPWMAPNDRPVVGALRASYRDQDGARGALSQLTDRPVAISFFYTRCENPRKCAAAVCRMADLQRDLFQAGLADRVRLLMISYEPHYDTPARLRSYGSSRGVRFGQGALMVTLDECVHMEVVRALEAPVNYNAGWVNVHGIALFLLDTKGRLARRYHTVLWDNRQVLEDLRKLSLER